VRIAVSSSPFRSLFSAGRLTQLEWVERCASALGADGVVADVSDFPRTDAEYVAQLRKVAIDLALVPFGLDAPELLLPEHDDEARARTLAVATGFGAAVIRTQLPPPGDVPPATFVEAVTTAKGASKAAKAVNVTLVVAARPNTIAEDLGGVKHLLKDVDSAWLRACPRALDLRGGVGPKDRYPAWEASVDDDARTISEIAQRAWVILDAPPHDGVWETLARAIGALRA
jgi:hypothetical protein